MHDKPSVATGDSEIFEFCWLLPRRSHLSLPRSYWCSRQVIMKKAVGAPHHALYDAIIRAIDQGPSKSRAGEEQGWPRTTKLRSKDIDEM